MMLLLFVAVAAAMPEDCHPARAALLLQSRNRSHGSDSGPPEAGVAEIFGNCLKVVVHERTTTSSRRPPNHWQKMAPWRRRQMATCRVTKQASRRRLRDHGVFGQFWDWAKILFAELSGLCFSLWLNIPRWSTR